MKESEVFYNVSGLNKAYEEVRADILERHGIKEGTKARLKNAIAMYQKFTYGDWVKVCTVKVDMIDRVLLYSAMNNTEFKLIAMV